MKLTKVEIEQFRSEAWDLLDMAERSLITLAPGDDFSSSYFAIFRSLHNLKGGAELMNFHQLTSHTHQLETILTQFKEQEIIPLEYRKILLQGLAAARLMLNDFAGGSEVNRNKFLDGGREVPLAAILGRLKGVVRDLSTQLAKEITLNIRGAQTELNSNLLEVIKDPLTHIVRNSCDHGIESADIRLSLGKPKIGRLQVSAYRTRGQVIIEVSDDGKGLSRDIILKKALERNLILPTHCQKLSDKEVFDLIFLPGFSTVSSITPLSGRGVGMDVVRVNIKSIGGTVSLWGKENVGTKIIIKIPLNLAVTPALKFA